MHQSLRFIVCRLNTAQHVSGILMPIIRSSKTVTADSGYTYVCGCRLPLRWLSHLFGSFYEIYITMHGSMNVRHLIYFIYLLTAIG
jgi:hypothetical protein